MASVYSSPASRPNTPDTRPADSKLPPPAGPEIDIILFGGTMIVISLIVVLTIFFGLYWDILVSATQHPLRPAR